MDRDLIRVRTSWMLRCGLCPEFLKKKKKKNLQRKTRLDKSYNESSWKPRIGAQCAIRENGSGI